MTEDEITTHINAWQLARDNQQHEVAAKFACEARSHLRVGKVELANRKMAAAIAVANGSNAG
jgi:hypothetical protein